MFDSFMMDWTWLGSVALRLLLAFILGGLVGYEREKASRPAGFRTHILVCLGSALVMITGEYLARELGPQTRLDPSRMGAQVVSGIGFLGAGTIIRTGASVRGLTTAASLWAVACIGLAVGSGFLPGALFATFLTFLVLITLKALEHKVIARRGTRNLLIVLDRYSSDVSKILMLTDELKLTVRRIQLLPPEEEGHEDDMVRLRLSLHRLDPEHKVALVGKIHELSSVVKVVDD